MQDFSVEGGPQNVRGCDFSRVERNITIEKSPKFCGNCSKIGIKINKNLQNYWENSRKTQTFRKIFLNFPAGNNLLIIGKIRD